MSAKPPPPPPPKTAPGLTHSWLAAKLADRNDQLVRDIAVGLVSQGIVGMTDAQMTGLRVMCGFALRDAAQAARWYQISLRKQALPLAPPTAIDPPRPRPRERKTIYCPDATTAESPGFDADSTTVPWHRPPRGPE